MFNLRTSGIVAGTAFFLSFLIGLISRSTMPMLILRPLIFAVLFFVISGFIKILVDRFLPELMEEGGLMDDGFRPGSRIDITEGDSQPDSPDGYSPVVQSPAAMGARPDDSDDGVGDISDLSSKGIFSGTVAGAVFPGMDQNREEGYNGGGGLMNFSEPSLDNMFDQDSPLQAGGRPVAETKAASAAYSSEEALPDLDSMAGAFSSDSSEEGEQAAEYSGTGPQKKIPDKPPAWAEDFNAKEMAAGLRTILNKEKEG